MTSWRRLWIQATVDPRPCIRQRHQVEAEYTSDLAIAAARQALVNANLEAADIDGIICATATPDYTFPGVASMVQAALGAKTGPCYDLQAVCAGFLYSLVQAAAWLKAEGSERILIVGARPFPVCSTMKTVAQRCCLAMAQGRWCSSRSMTPVGPRRLTTHGRRPYPGAAMLGAYRAPVSQAKSP